jgi:tRNA modification GTPase
MNARETAPAFVSVLTGDSRGAIAVVRIWGPGALHVAEQVFRPRRGPLLSQTPPGRLRSGQMGAGLGDKVVAVVVPPDVEVQCHGGPEPLALVIAALESAGAVAKPALEWIRAVAPSPLAAAAWADLARTSTVRSAEILLAQAHGALDRALRRVADALDTNAAEACLKLDRLIDRASVGLHLLSGWRVVLAGRPNVGKSRLLNALAGFERSIVHSTSGTTRDIVTVATAIDGWPIELVDTAGLRDAQDSLEASGVALACAAHDAADLVLLVLDRSEFLTDADRALVARHPNALCVANKGDLPAAWEPAELQSLVVSAERGDGLDRLAEALRKRIVPNPPDVPAAVPFRPRQHALLQETRAWLAAGRNVCARETLRLLMHAPEASCQ